MNVVDNELAILWILKKKDHHTFEYRFLTTQFNGFDGHKLIRIYSNLKESSTTPEFVVVVYWIKQKYMHLLVFCN